MPEIDFLLPYSLGVELEVCDFSTNPRDVDNVEYRGIACTGEGLSDWLFKYDGSAGNGSRSYGFEVCSPIMVGTYLTVREKVKKMIDWLKSHGAKVNANCGFHVHVGLAHLNKAQLDRVIAFLIRYERGFFALANETRQANRYAKPVSAEMVKRVKRIRKEESLAPVAAWTSSNESGTTDKYTWFNCLPMRSKGTIEFRLQEGTLDLDHVMGWLVTLSHAIDSVASATDTRRLGKSKTEYPALSLHNLLARGGFYGANCSEPERAKVGRNWAAERFRTLHGYSHRTRISEVQALKKVVA